MARDEIDISKIESFAKSLNDSIRDVLKHYNDVETQETVENSTLFSIDYNAIKESFHNHSSLTWNDIFNRLVLIDSLYSTNVVRMREFGIVHITNAIWDLCNNGKGIYSDMTLVNKVENFVAQIQTRQTPIVPDISNLLLQYYGWVNTTNSKPTQQQAVSLISKYLYFLLQVNATNNIGFPIYDKLVRKLLPKIAKKTGVIVKGTLVNNMVNYTKVISDIINVLEKYDQNLWNQQNPFKTKFALFDFVFWHVGKVGDKNLSLLFSEKEYIKHYSTIQSIKKGNLSIGNSNLPTKIKIFDNINKTL